MLFSNGNVQYFWHQTQDTPLVIAKFPDPASSREYKKFEPNPDWLAAAAVEADYLVRTQLPGYAAEAGWKNVAVRAAFSELNRLQFLRPYQLRAVQQLQAAVAEGKQRFLFEMAPGTGKTITAAAISKLFLQTGNARRVLFLVDRPDLEVQANKEFNRLLGHDYASVIHHEHPADWDKAEIVVATVQSLLFKGNYRRLFAPTDFDLVISDEAHRAIGGNARTVFEYFGGYKLGLTATPKDFLKRFDYIASGANDPRRLERRLLLDTYRTFGCSADEPTFRYTLPDGVKDGFLVNPVNVDARIDLTTQQFYDEGYAVLTDAEARASSDEETYVQRDFEQAFLSEATNRLFCEAFLRHAVPDPVSGETGKSIVFAVSQQHAATLTQLLNEVADRRFPGRYESDFAVQVTAQVPEARQYASDFVGNKLMGSGNFLPAYHTSKARVCVTVGMMTTGYDCPDILNVALMRPVFSPSDFLQIKGRGTRPHNFLDNLSDEREKALVRHPEKVRFKFFDFFANCEFFEENFVYDQLLHLPSANTSKS